MAEVVDEDDNDTEEKREVDVGVAEVVRIVDVAEVVIEFVADDDEAGDVKPPYVHNEPNGICRNLVSVPRK